MGYSHYVSIRKFVYHYIDIVVWFPNQVVVSSVVAEHEIIDINGGSIPFDAFHTRFRQCFPLRVFCGKYKFQIHICTVGSCIPVKFVHSL